MSKKLVYALLLVLVFSIGFVGSVYAYTTTFVGRAQYYGYFDNQRDTAGHNVLPIMSGGQAIPSSVDTVSEFMTFLRDAYNSSTPQRKTGAAFIVYTMLGSPAPGVSGSFASRTVGSAVWTELESRLDARQAANRIDWNYTINLGGSCNSSYYQGDPGPDDDAFYDPTDSGQACLPNGFAGIRFLNDDGTSYILQRLCANPVGDIQPVENVPAPNPTPNPTPTPGPNACRPIIRTTPAVYDYRGNLIRITATVTNQTTGQRLTYTSSSSPAYFDFTTGCTTGEVWSVRYTTSTYEYRAPRTTCRTTTSGSVRCTTTRYRRSLNLNGGNIGPCFDYQLDASVGSLTQHVEAGANVTVRPAIDYRSWTRDYYSSFYNRYRTISKSKNSEWQITKLTVYPNRNVPTVANADSLLSPCTYYRTKSGIGDCSVVRSGNVVFNTNGTRYSGTNPLSSRTETIDDLPAGTKICYAFSVKASQSDPDNTSASINSSYWNHSSISSSSNCTIVAKKPKVQITGGDVSVGKTFGTSNPEISDIRTSTSTKNSNTFGSWVEYGLFATGTSVGMASGSAFAGPGLTSATMCRYNTLSFTNSGSSSCTSSTTIGRYNPVSHIPDVSSMFTTGSSTPTLGSSVNLGSGSLQGVYKTSGNMTITGGDIRKGQWIVINAPSSTITISGDIQYTNEVLNSTTDIPQVVIIARDINIRGNVNRVDAWLIATNDLNTCSSLPVSASLTAYDSCQEQLVVNGPVMATTLYLRRTAGSEPGGRSGDPAEVFNLRPDAYLWADTIATDGNHIQTVYSVELPARF